MCIFSYFYPKYLEISGLVVIFLIFDKLGFQLFPCYFNVGNVQQTYSVDYGLAWRRGCSIHVCWSLEVRIVKCFTLYPLFRK